MPIHGFNIGRTPAHMGDWPLIFRSKHLNPTREVSDWLVAERINGPNAVFQGRYISIKSHKDFETGHKLRKEGKKAYRTISFNKERAGGGHHSKAITQVNTGTRRVVSDRE